MATTRSLDWLSLSTAHIHYGLAPRAPHSHARPARHHTRCSGSQTQLAHTIWTLSHAGMSFPSAYLSHAGTSFRLGYKQGAHPIHGPDRETRHTAASSHLVLSYTCVNTKIPSGDPTKLHALFMGWTGRSGTRLPLFSWW